jgi:hypothetical protein
MSRAALAGGFFLPLQNFSHGELSKCTMRRELSNSFLRILVELDPASVILRIGFLRTRKLDGAHTGRR